ncbi:MAG: helix-turn-helix transcriptional regulator [Fimbriimonadaceae bacterium]|nr:MAG: helix-turn-helix transcriptional regulator [Fimbriimonadaceae bacterium]
MGSPVQTPEYDLFRSMLIDARMQSGLSQRAVCKGLNKVPTYISKVEAGIRRLDSVETIELLIFLKVNPVQFFTDYLKNAKEMGYLIEK